MPLDRLPIHDQVVEEISIRPSPGYRPLRLRRVKLTREQHASHQGGKCWGVLSPDGKPVWAQVLLHEVRGEDDELLALVVLMNRGVDGEAFFDLLPDEYWTRGYEGADPVSGTSWRITGWQAPDSANQGRSVQRPLESGITADEVWEYLVLAMQDGRIKFRGVPQ